MNSSVEESKKYLRLQVNPILEQLVAALMRAKPERPVAYMRDWLVREGPILQNKIETRMRTRPEGLKSTSESEGEEEEQDKVAEAPQPVPVPKRSARISVSAEVYGDYNKKKEFTPPVYAKNAEQRERILQKTARSFLFSALEPREQEIIVNAMQIVSFPAGSRVITQGDRGDQLFLVDSGVLDCHRVDEAGVSTHLVSYGPGDAFGELALLYNAPRAATIDARVQSVLLSLDRETFNHIVKDAMVRRRQLFYDFLRNIELFDSLNNSEKDKICDVMQSKTYRDGEVIIREGDQGDTFFCVQKGHCKTFKLNPQTGKEEMIHQYREFDYFGELALLRNTPRAATIVADGDVTLASIDRPAFKRLMGPLEEILKRNSKRYETYVLRESIAK